MIPYGKWHSVAFSWSESIICLQYLCPFLIWKYIMFYFVSFEIFYNNVLKFVLFYAFLRVTLDTASCADWLIACVACYSRECSALFSQVFVCIFEIYIQFFPYCFFVSNSQVIGCEDRPRNDLYCAGWGVKFYSIQTICICVSDENEMHVNM